MVGFSLPGVSCLGADADLYPVVILCNDTRASKGADCRLDVTLSLSFPCDELL